MVGGSDTGRSGFLIRRRHCVGTKNIFFAKTWIRRFDKPRQNIMHTRPLGCCFFCGVKSRLVIYMLTLFFWKKIKFKRQGGPGTTFAPLQLRQCMQTCQVWSGGLYICRHKLCIKNQAYRSDISAMHAYEATTSNSSRLIE